MLAVLAVACSTQPSANATQTSSPCKLAVIRGSPGFLTVPGGVFSPAPGAGSGTYYDKPLRKWVPGGPPALAADGLRYAYVEGDTAASKAHMVDLKSGADVVVATGGPWEIAGLGPDAVYVMRIEYQDSAAYGRLAIGRGLSNLPLSGGSPTELTSDAEFWRWFAQGAVYGGGITLDVAGGPNDVIRFDVGTMRTTTWFSHNVRSRLVAVDASGAALILAESDHSELWRVARPDAAVKVWSGATDTFVPIGPVAVDGSDVWMSSAPLKPSWDIVHFSPGGGLRRVATFTDRVTVAGPCA